MKIRQLFKIGRDAWTKISPLILELLELTCRGWRLIRERELQTSYLFQPRYTMLQNNTLIKLRYLTNLFGLSHTNVRRLNFALFAKLYYNYKGRKFCYPQTRSIRFQPFC
ncbi:hypothetical protein PR048_032377 [Dryococelus australis]|uniref:Uncharacterized protein n=1 Tax=Dryococelus australis TaxID=614101 RepID=A0ABQ9G663_9NEOP|nr:hypothetical protein PR048_032377 [Dryococelus australis]